MDLDWCTDEDLNNSSKFNENSIISKNKKNAKEEIIELNSNSDNNLVAENCYNQNLDVNNEKDLLNIMNYLSIVSNYLRTFIRNKSSKYNDNILINQNDFDLLLNYLSWLQKSCIVVKNFFAIPLRKDNSFDPTNIKPFKTSSYKFCNLKETCVIHRNKNKVCDKNHFVFEMIINDIEKLINSMNLLQINNFNLILSNKYILVSYNPNDNNYNIEQINNTVVIDQNDNNFIIDKTLVFKSFDVISYVINKMYEESYSFLNFNVKSLLINI